MRIPSLSRLIGIAILLGFAGQCLAQTSLGGSRHSGPGTVAASGSSFGLGVSRDNGATFVSSAAVTETVLIRGEIRPEAADIGTPADIFVVDRLLENSSFLMRIASGVWVSWNGSIATLQPFREDEILDAVESLDLFTGTLGTAGNHRFFLGYMPADGILRYHTNGLPLAITSPAQAAGNHDASFNGAGEVLTTFGAGSDVINAMAIQADGKIVVAGRTEVGGSVDFALARYNTDGSLDASFDNDGKLTTFITGAGSRDVANSMVIQPDGKIVVAGTADVNVVLVRYNTNGSLDTSFGSGGKVTTSVTNQTWTGSPVALQANGKILVAGDGFSIARYNTDGSLDTSFGAGGVRSSTHLGNSSASTINAMAVQADGKIIISGHVMNVGRLNTDGSVDTTFGTLGVNELNIGLGSVVGMELLIQPDGKIVAAGSVDNQFAMFRLNTDGSLETIFERTIGPNVALRDIARQADGKLVAAGYTRKYQNINGDFVVRRYNTDGSIDSQFGKSGVVLTELGAAPYGGGELEGGRAVAIQADGKIVVGGSVMNGVNTDFVLVRYE